MQLHQPFSGVGCHSAFRLQEQRPVVAPSDPARMPMRSVVVGLVVLFGVAGFLGQ